MRLTLIAILSSIGLILSSPAPARAEMTLAGQTPLTNPVAQQELRMAVDYWTRLDIRSRYGLHPCPVITMLEIPDGSGAQGWGIDCEIWLPHDIATTITARQLRFYDRTIRDDVEELRDLERQRCTIIRHEVGHAFGIGDQDGPIGNVGLVVVDGHIPGDPLMTQYVQDFETPADCDALARRRWRVRHRVNHRTAEARGSLFGRGVRTVTQD